MRPRPCRPCRVCIFGVATRRRERTAVLFGEIATKEDGEEYIQAENDLFHLESPDSRWSMKELHKGLLEAYQKPKKDTGRGTPDPTADYVKIPKCIISHEEAWPEPKETPYFNHAVFYSSLKEYRKKEKGSEDWGDVFMYGEVVTSTNTLLERYGDEL